MDTNQQNNNNNTSSAFSTWNLEKNIMESTNEVQHHQIPMGSAGICWPNYNNNMATLFAPPSSSSSSPSLTTVPNIIEVVEEEDQEGEEELGAMKEMMYKIAAMQPVDIDPASIRKPKRRNVRISDDPQSVAARHRRERISEKIRILQRLVPGGTKMDTASMLDEAIRYVKFLKRQIRLLQSINNNPQFPPPQQYCTPNYNPNSTLLLAPSTTDHWPFAPPNVLLPPSSTAAAAVDLPPAGVGFDGPSSSSFNHHHHEVISE